LLTIIQSILNEWRFATSNCFEVEYFEALRPHLNSEREEMRHMLIKTV
jgi:hypothetical protein